MRLAAADDTAILSDADRRTLRTARVAVAQAVAPPAVTAVTLTAAAPMTAEASVDPLAPLRATWATLQTAAAADHDAAVLAVLAAVGTLVGPSSSASVTP